MQSKCKVILNFNEEEDFIPTTIKSLDKDLTMIGGIIKIKDEEYDCMEYRHKILLIEGSFCSKIYDFLNLELYFDEKKFQEEGAFENKDFSTFPYYSFEYHKAQQLILVTSSTADDGQTVVLTKDENSKWIRSDGYEDHVKIALD